MDGRLDTVKRGEADGRTARHSQREEGLMDGRLDTVKGKRPMDGRLATVKGKRPMDGRLDTVKGKRPVDGRLATVKGKRPVDGRLATVKGKRPMDGRLETVKGKRPADGRLATVKGKRPMDGRLATVKGKRRVAERRLNIVVTKRRLRNMVGVRKRHMRNTCEASPTCTGSTVNNWVWGKGDSEVLAPLINDCLASFTPASFTSTFFGKSARTVPYLLVSNPSVCLCL